MAAGSSTGREDAERKFSQKATKQNILFHFKSKSMDSLLFEEFNSVVVRNTTNKIKSHELFAKFLNKLQSTGYRNGVRVQLQRKCEKSGWPIDIRLSPTDENDNTPSSSLYFFLQEEMATNISTGLEEPLALQKLMLRHVRSTGSNVDFVTEKQVFKQGFDSKWVQDLI